MSNGLFIAFEGTDASGKTTLTYALKKAFEEAGRTVTLVGHSEFLRSGFDTETYLGRKLQALDPVVWGGSRPHDPIDQVPVDCWIYLLGTWYTLLSIHLIEPQRRAGHVIIADSWVYKQIVHHNLAGTLDEAYVLRHFALAAKPDLTFFLRVSPEVTWQRRDDHLPRDYGVFSGSKELSREAYLGHQRRLGARFQPYAERNGWVILDGEKDPDELRDEALSHVRQQR
ncbi:hypothetical protein WMF37_45995 [Sorangium sp. So ce291]|uniref:dTMP kinase n=1 Tax=Sorangium sp. So ce291 TaxID=3133294 RepID=UPI003F5D7027